MIVTGIEGTISVPRFHFHAKDDLGGSYRSWDYPGGGVPGRNHYWRYFYLCTPGINPNAGNLRLEVSEIKITEMPRPQASNSIYEPIEQIDGPWVFDVSLTGQKTIRHEDH